MAEEKKKKPPERPAPRVEIEEEVADGTYANVANIIFSPVEFVFDFGRGVPGRPHLKIMSRIIMSPLTAKQFLKNLTDHVARFEQQFGEIKIPAKMTPEPPPGFKQ
jgi:hypothetical protein